MQTIILTQTDHQAATGGAEACVSQALPPSAAHMEAFLSYGASTFDPVHRDPPKKGKSF